MSIITGSTQTKSVVTDTPPLEPEQVIEQLRALRGRIPEFVQLPLDGSTKKIRRVASINVVFAREAFTTIGASDAIQNIVGSTPNELHAAEDEAARWTAVETELRAMLAGVVAANVIRRERIGRVVLQAYNVSTQLVKEPEHAFLLPHVSRMRQMKKFGRRRPKPAAEPQQPAATQAKTV